MNLRDILRTKGADVVTIRQDASLLEAARDVLRHVLDRQGDGCHGSIIDL